MPAETTVDGRFEAGSLAAFYRWNAAIYDVTRPFILYGRREAVEALRVGRGDVTLDVGCGTGRNIPLLLERCAKVTAIDSSPAMLARARRRAILHGATSRVEFDDAPYGTHSRYDNAASRVLFSYSLSMIPPFERVVERARRDLRPGGRIAVVDFLDSPHRPVRAWLRMCHVHLGQARLRALAEAFPGGSVVVRRTLLWSYFLFSAVRS